MTIACPENGTGVCSIMEEAGAGLGIFIQYLGQALPTLLLILIIVGIVGAIGFAIASVISGFISTVKMK
jgi:F0F1-type ATP synthase assembly protein I